MAVASAHPDFVELLVGRLHQVNMKLHRNLHFLMPPPALLRGMYVRGA